MVDPTSEVGENVDPDEAPRCGTCGDTVVDAPNHRVVTWIDAGSVESAHFCDDDCRATWSGESG